MNREFGCAGRMTACGASHRRLQVTGASRRSIFKGPRMQMQSKLALLLCLQSVVVFAKDPAILYTMECQGCHLADGSGGLASIPALNEHVALFLDVPGGREYLARVPGVAQSTLSDRELTDVLNWLLRKFGPADALSRNALYDADEIAQLRKRPMTEVSETRAALVSLIEQRTPLSPSH